MIYANREICALGQTQILPPQKKPSAGSLGYAFEERSGSIARTVRFAEVGRKFTFPVKDLCAAVY